MTIERRLALAASAIVLLLAGCSSDGEPSANVTSAPSSPTQTATTTAAPDPSAELRAAVQAYSDAYLTGDGAAAYGMISEQCRDEIGEAAMLESASAAKDLYGSALPMESFDAQVSGDLARVTYTYSVAGINQAGQSWVREDGSWRYDDC